MKGFLLDITGVLYNSDPNSMGRVIQGSVEAVNRFPLLIDRAEIYKVGAKSYPHVFFLKVLTKC